MKFNRRDCLTTTGGALAASALSLPNLAYDPKKGDTLYGHGMVWNNDLKGVPGQLKLAFDLRVNLQTGKGFGTASDPVHPDWGIQFEITDSWRESIKDEDRFTLQGKVVSAVNPSMVGLPVKIIAQTEQGITAVAIRVGDLAFAGAGLVVIAIIAILIGLLLPAVQK